MNVSSVLGTFQLKDDEVVHASYTAAAVREKDTTLIFVSENFDRY